MNARSARRASLLVPLAALALLAAPASAQRRPGEPTAGPPALPPGVTREQMWPAPSADDWKKPCLVPFQRTWEDAQAVAKETGKPILVCVNMDGEIASEHYAGVRYRQPEIAKLYDPYVCVIASVYRHTPRDHDEQGRRILCPRFGSVTCGEHIAIEPGLYEKFMDGERVSPRHIAVELDGKEKYDVYFTWDTDTVFNMIRDGVAGREEPKTVVRGDRPITERVASRDVADRTAVEAAYAQGDAAQRRALLDAAKAHPEAAPTELLRQGVFGFDVDLGKLARAALAKAESPDAAGLIGEALRVPMDPGEKTELIAALQRLGDASPRARTLAVVYQGLGSRSSTLDVEGWKSALERTDATPPDPAARAERLGKQDAILSSQDPAAHLDLAEAFAEDALAHEAAAGGDGDPDAEFTRLLWMDAQETALKAERLGAHGWRVDAIAALAAAHLGDRAEARRRAEAAAGSRPEDGATARSAAALAVLELFAKSRGEQIGLALRAKSPWPAQWLADMHAAYTLLLRHPLGTDAHAASHYDVLKWLGAPGEATRFLEVGLLRFPTSVSLHDRMRTRALEEQGAAGLETAYDEWLAKALATDGVTVLERAAFESFAGYASLVAAEFQRRAGAYDAALAAYDRGIAHYERAIAAAPDDRAAADHYVAMALAGRARIAFERKDDARSLADLLACFERRPDAAVTNDGLGISPAATARDLRARLLEQKQTELVAKLEAAIARLDPELLRQPDLESLLPAAPATR